MNNLQLQKLFTLATFNGLSHRTSESLTPLPPLPKFSWKIIQFHSSVKLWKSEFSNEKGLFPKMCLIKQHIFQGEFRAHCYCCLIISTAPAKQKVALVTFQHQRGYSAATCVCFKLPSSNTDGAFHGRLQRQHSLTACVLVLLPRWTLQHCRAPCALFALLMHHSWAVCVCVSGVSVLLHIFNCKWWLLCYLL